MRIGFSSSALAALLLASAPPAFAQAAQEAARRYEIAPGPLDQALPAFARQSGLQILYPAALVAGRRSPGLSGTHTPEAALAAVLEGETTRRLFSTRQYIDALPGKFWSLSGSF